MSVVGKAHAQLVFGGRVERLASVLAEELPEGASVLDVGCGDGSIAALILAARPDISIQGVDVLVRPETKIAVTEFDGVTLPFDDDSFDVVLFVDVLHHTDDAAVSLAEANRVAPKLLVKDHLTDGVLAVPTLRAMDWVGNRHHGVRLPYNYLSEAEWRSLFERLGYVVDSWNVDVGVYPAPLTWVFDRELHVVFSAHRRDGAPGA